MSPQGDESANLAMRDAADLALALTDSGDLRKGVKNFEPTLTLNVLAFR